MKQTLSVQSLIESIRQWIAHPKIKAIAFRLAALSLVVAVIAIIYHNPELILRADPISVGVVLLIGVPATVLANTIEVQKLATLLGGQLSFRQAFQLNIIGSAANLLPIPGATVVRIGAMKVQGVHARRTFVASLILVGVWLALCFLLAGLAAVFHRHVLLGSGLVAFGFLGIVAAIVISYILYRAPAAFSCLMMSKCALVLSDGFRLFFCLAAVGHTPDLLQVAGLLPSSVLGSAVSIVPAGLGVREGIGAALAPILSLDAGAVLVAMTLNRILGLMIVAPLAIQTARQTSDMKQLVD